MVEPRTLEITEDRRPYAPAANVLAVIERVRRLNLPTTVDNDFLRLADVPEGSLGRVSFALRFLGLTDLNDRPTDQLRAIARATEEEYRELLAGIVRAAYAPDFERVNPAAEPQAKIVSAFQRYEPRSQTTRMVMLFLGLAKAAGIAVMEAPRERGLQGTSRPTARPRATTNTTGRSSRPVASPSVSAATPVTAGPSPAQPGLLFGVTVDDVAALSDAQFPAVWEALGVIARARAQSLKAARDMAEQAAARREAESTAEEDPTGRQ